MTTAARSSPSRSALPSWEWGVALVVAVFVLTLARPASLGTPYWWDAGAVYVPGAKWLEQHGFDASPGVFPSELGRGHTPGFYLVLALVFRIFGTSPSTGHALVLLASASALVFTYALGAELVGRLRAALACALLATSPLFLTMSSEALPEIPMTALTVAALYAFARGRFLASALVGTALVLFKEVGVACPLAIVGASAFAAAGARSDRARWVKAGALQAIPLAALTGFFLWQRAREGWFVLPYHAGLWNEHHDLVEQLGRVLGSTLWSDGRGIALGVAVGGALVARRGTNLVQVPPVAMALVLLALANFVFFGKMFYLERYTLPVHPAVALGIVAAIPRTPRAGPAGFAAVVLACAIGLASRDAGEGYDSGETTFRYLRAIRVHQRALGAIPVGTRVLTTWPMTDELRRPYLGYVREPLDTTSIEYVEAIGAHPEVDAVVVFDSLGNAEKLRAMARERGLVHVRRESEAGATVEVWTR